MSDLERAQEWLGCHLRPDSTWCDEHALPWPCPEATRLAALLAETRVDALNEAAEEMDYIIAEGDVAAVAAPVEGEVGRAVVVARRDALYEEPASWLRERANRDRLQRSIERRRQERGLA